MFSIVLIQKVYCFNSQIKNCLFCQDMSRQNLKIVCLSRQKVK